MSAEKPLINLWASFRKEGKKKKKKENRKEKRREEKKKDKKAEKHQRKKKIMMKKEEECLLYSMGVCERDVPTDNVTLLATFHCYV